MNFSIVIPSRNRPALLDAAVRSVLAQTHAAFEILIVDDGSDAAHDAAYRNVAALSGRIRLIRLARTANGHGPSYAINRGAEQAAGFFLGFLDDDDSWTDPEHLDRAWRTLSAAPDADLYLSTQRACIGETAVETPLWLESLIPAIRREAEPDAQGAYPVTLDLLMQLHGFPHLNNTLVRRTLYEAVGGMDETIRYECEWDMYLRLADRAAGIRYYPGFVSRHNVPDPTKTSNASTSVGAMQKLRFRAAVMDKALLYARAPAIRRAAAAIQAVTYRHLAESLARGGRPREAWLYARQALALRFGFKWLARCVVLGLAALGRTSDPSSCSRGRP